MNNMIKINKFKVKSGMIEKPSVVGRMFDILIILLVAVLALICIIPMWHVLMSSISNGFDLLSHKGLVILPVGKATLDGYKLVLSNSGVMKGYLNTLIYVAGTTLLGLVLNVIGGYTLSQDTKLRTPMIMYVMITMMFNGGLIPTYMVLQKLGFVGNRLAIILPEATMAIYLMMSMNAFKTVPKSTIEAARIDGAGHIKVMFRVMLPQCIGIFAVTILNTFIYSWNSWLSAKIYLATFQDKWPLQLWINEIVSTNREFLNTSNPNYSRYLIQYAVIIAATLPILIAIPFFQKYIERGVIGGAVKE